MNQNNQAQTQSFLNQSVDEFKQVPVEQLSGDQGIDKTVMITFKNQGKANLFQTSSTVINSVIGAGIIAMPYTVSVMGWLFSIIICILVAIINNYTIAILLKSKNLSRHSTYNSIAYHISRSKYLIFIISFVNMFSNVGFGNFFSNYILAVAMLSILKSSFRKLMIEIFTPNEENMDNFYYSEWFIAVVLSVVIIPTILIKKIERLKIFSIVGVIAIVLAIVSISIIFFVQMGQRNWENNFTMMAFPKEGMPVLSVLPNILFALVWQTNFFSIYKGLKNSTDKRITIASAGGVAFSTLIYIVLGLMGYALFGRDTSYIDANFLLEMNSNQINIILYSGVYLGFLISDLFCIPVTFLVARNNLIVMIKILFVKQNYNFKKPKTLTQHSAIQQIGSFIPGKSKQQIKKKAQILYYVYTMSLYVVYVLITILVSSLAAVFNIVGAVASTGISFFIPFLFYVVLIAKKNKPKTINYYLSIVGLILSIPLGVLSIVSLYL